jgi:hypothetical protein
MPLRLAEAALEFAQSRCKIPLHCICWNAQPLRDLPVRKAVASAQDEYFAFGGCEARGGLRHALAQRPAIDCH